MDQIKIGKFISTVRKEHGLTQRQLAEKLNISDKTVSKWETGKGIPEVSLMLPLCNELHINVNELLSGERISEGDYHRKAEENMMNLIKEKEEAKKKLILSAVVGIITIVAGVALILVSGFAELTLAVRITLIAIAIIVIAGGIGVACVLDREAGTFECRKCGERFTPTMKEYIAGAHTLTTRRLICPKCGEKSYCRRRLTK